MEKVVSKKGGDVEESLDNLVSSLRGEKGEGKDQKKADVQSPKKDATKDSVLEGIDPSKPMNQYIGGKLHHHLEKVSKQSADKISNDVMLDLYYSFYLPFPKVRGDAKDAPQKNIVENALQSPEMEQTRKTSSLDSAISSAAAVEFANSFIKDLQKAANSSDPEKAKNAQEMLDQLQGNGQHEQQNQGKQQQPQQGQQGQQGQQQGEQGQQGQQEQDQQGSGQPQQGQQQGQGNSKSDIMKQAMQNALSRAQDTAEGMKGVKDFLDKAERGSQAGKGSSGELLMGDNIDRIIALAKKTNISEILKLLEGFPELVLSSSKKYKEDTSGENLEYEKGNDVARVVPGELALPDVVFYAKFSQKDLLLFKKGKEKEPGQVYVLVDRSSSMDSQSKSQWAKAVALALYLRSRGDGRDFYMRFFDDHVHQLKSVKRGESGKALDTLEYIAGTRADNGTDIVKAIDAACSDIEKLKLKEKTTIVLITDGEDDANVASNMVRIRENLKKANAVLISVMIQGKNPNLEQLSENFMEVRDLSGKEALDVVNKAKK